MATWITHEDADALSAAWPDVPFMDPTVLDMYLAAAKSAVIAYAPALPEGTADIPADYRLAQIMQARNIYNAGQAPTNGESDMSAGGYGISSFPLDWHVKQLLRPQLGKGPIW